MKSFNKISFNTILMVIISLSFISCFKEVNTVSSEPTANPSEIRIGTSQFYGSGLCKLIEDNQNEKTSLNYEFTSKTNVREILTLLQNNELDIAILPANTAGLPQITSITKSIALYSSNATYLLTNDETTTEISDFNRKNLAVYLSPTQKYLFDTYFVPKLNPDNIYYYTNPNFYYDYSIDNNPFYIVLCEPYSSAFDYSREKNNLEQFSTINLNKELHTANIEALNIESVIVVHNNFINKYENYLNTIIQDMKNSITYVNKPENNEECAQLIVMLGIISSIDVAKRFISVPYFNIITGSEFKNKYKNFLEQINPASIVPDDFYHILK